MHALGAGLAVASSVHASVLMTRLCVRAVGASAASASAVDAAGGGAALDARTRIHASPVAARLLIGAHYAAAGADARPLAADLEAGALDIDAVGVHASASLVAHTISWTARFRAALWYAAASVADFVTIAERRFFVDLAVAIVVQAIAHFARGLKAWYAHGSVFLTAQRASATAADEPGIAWLAAGFAADAAHQEDEIIEVMIGLRARLAIFPSEIEGVVVRDALPAEHLIVGVCGNASRVESVLRVEHAR